MTNVWICIRFGSSRRANVTHTHAHTYTQISHAYDHSSAKISKESNQIVYNNVKQTRLVQFINEHSRAKHCMWAGVRWRYM